MTEDKKTEYCIDENKVEKGTKRYKFSMTLLFLISGVISLPITFFILMKWEMSFNIILMACLFGQLICIAVILYVNLKKPGKIFDLSQKIILDNDSITHFYRGVEKRVLFEQIKTVTIIKDKEGKAGAIRILGDSSILVQNLIGDLPLIVEQLRTKVDQAKFK